MLIDSYIQELENAVKQNKSCHEINPSSADQEMLQTIRSNGCLDKENCSHPNCIIKDQVMKDCISRWNNRKNGSLSDRDTMFILYTILQDFLR